MALLAVLLVLYTGIKLGSTADCLDDPTFDCAHISTVFNICADVNHAKAVCRKFCNLCDQPSVGPRDCQDALTGHLASLYENVYLIKAGPSHINTIVQCDMVIYGGGWTMLMHRDSASVDFNRNSSEYAKGFGDIAKTFWIGLESMHALTSDGRRYQLLVKLTTANDSIYHEFYDEFSVGPAPNFVLHLGQAQGTAGDSMGSHSGFPFTTIDADHDTNAGNNCAKYLGGGWWFHVCYDACLTCPYVTPGTTNCASMAWNKIHYCTALKSATMFVRPRK